MVIDVLYSSDEVFDLMLSQILYVILLVVLVLYWPILGIIVETVSEVTGVDLCSII